MESEKQSTENCDSSIPIPEEGYEKLSEETQTMPPLEAAPPEPEPIAPNLPVTGSETKLEIVLSKEQLKLPKNNSTTRRVSVQSPPKELRVSLSPRKTSNTEKGNGKDWSTRVICKFCGKIYNDPRVLFCLHNFCLECLNKIVDPESDGPMLEKSSSETNSSSNSGDALRPPSSWTNTRRASQKSFSSVATSVSKSRSSNANTTLNRNIICPICGTLTPIPAAGISRLPQNAPLNRLVENFSSHHGIHQENCEGCDKPLKTILKCTECSLNLCSVCSEAHKKQKITSNHKLMKIIETKAIVSKPPAKTPKKCPFHPNSDLKLFCTGCSQVACTECAAALHQGHKCKCESIHKAAKVYTKLLNDSISRVRPTCDYALLTISKLVAINKKIDKKCDQVRREVDAHLIDYQRALDRHRNTLLKQVQKAHELKVAGIESQKSELEKRSTDAKTTIEFAELMLENGTDADLMSFVGQILRRIEYCEKSKVPLDANVNDSLKFLPEVRAPSSSAQNNIPLFGIITTQTADPNLCSVENKGLGNLKVNKPVELTLITRDRDNEQLCHGGLKLQIELKYGDFAGRVLEHRCADRRDGTYLIGFTPDAAGTLRLSISIGPGKPIKGSPFTLVAKNLKPHSGIYHCCSFCSSNGGKSAACACGGTMDRFNGCGHGHPGHPGRRHWSCCGNVLENSECLTANEFEF